MENLMEIEAAEHEARERRLDNLLQLGKAAARGDTEEMDRLLPLVQFEACSLKSAKILFGAEYIREKKLDTTKADLEFGPGWLDREEEVSEWKT